MKVPYSNITVTAATEAGLIIRGYGDGVTCWRGGLYLTLLHWLALWS